MPEGRPWSWTTMTIPVGDLVPPITLVYVDLDEGGPRVLARWGAESQPTEDMRIRVRVDAGTVFAHEASAPLAREED